METTIDKLLGGRFEVEQPKTGYRVAMDTLFLAAAIPARAGDNVLELGCGVGGVLLALAARVAGVAGVGVEIQPAFAALCAANICRNGREDAWRCEQGDVTTLPSRYAEGFDHVAMNPPYHDPARHVASAHESKRTANTEDENADLSAWIAAAMTALRPGGTVTLIHRADREDEILGLLSPAFGAIRVLRLCPKLDGPARRVIVRAIKNGTAGPITTQPPLILHAPDGHASAAADAVLRHAQSI